MLSEDQLFKDSQICSQAEIQYISGRAYLWKAHTNKNFFFEDLNEFDSPLLEVPSCLWINHHYFILSYFFLSLKTAIWANLVQWVSMLSVRAALIHFQGDKVVLRAPLGLKGKLNQNFCSSQEIIFSCVFVQICECWSGRFNISMQLNISWDLSLLLVL